MCKDEPKYLLTRLLLRKTNKIFSHNELSVRYSSELGEDKVATYMDILTSPLDFSREEHQQPSKPASGSSDPDTDTRQHDRFFTADELASLQHLQTASEPPSKDVQDAKAKDSKGSGKIARTSKIAPKNIKPLKPANNASNPIVVESSDDEITAVEFETKPVVVKTKSTHAKLDMESIATGLSKEEEDKDPELAKAIRLSKYEALKKTMASTETPNKSGSNVIRKEDVGANVQSDTSASSKGPADKSGKLASSPKPESDDFYRLKEGDTETITAFALGASDMAVEEMIRHLNMAELTLIAKELKCWKSKYSVSLPLFVPGIMHLTSSSCNVYSVRRSLQRSCRPRASKRVCPSPPSPMRRHLHVFATCHGQTRCQRLQSRVRQLLRSRRNTRIPFRDRERRVN